MKLASHTGAPGRVVNLLATGSDEDIVWGIAYQVDDQVWNDSVCAQLDHREKGGYQQNVELMFGSDFQPLDVIVYRGDVTDKQYAGPAPLEEMAATIQKAKGPSGWNKDYLYNLAVTLRDVIGHQDPHVLELEEAVKKLDKLAPAAQQSA